MEQKLKHSKLTCTIHNALCFKISLHLESPLPHPLCDCIFSYQKFEHLGFDGFGKGIPFQCFNDLQLLFLCYSLKQALVYLALIQYCLQNFHVFQHVYWDCQICHDLKVDSFFDEVMASSTTSFSRTFFFTIMLNIFL